jgi:hypothetical protein
MQDPKPSHHMTAEQAKLFEFRRRKINVLLAELDVLAVQKSARGVIFLFTWGFTHVRDSNVNVRFRRKVAGSLQDAIGDKR